MADAAGNRYGPYDIEVPGSEAEALTEEAWFDLFGHITGVKSGGELTFNGLTANLAPIDMRVHGSYLIREDPWSDASPPTDNPGPPRRDLLVGRRQRTSGEGAGATPGRTFPTVLRGTPAATPVDPPYDPVNDELLWSWQVPGNGGTVIAGQRDLRRRFASIFAPLNPVIASGNTTSRADGAEESWFVLTIPDPGYPYRIEANAWVRLFVNSGTRAEVRLRAGAAGGSDAALPILTFNSGMSNDTTGLDLILPSRTTPAVITGEGRLVGFCQRSAGAGSWSITPAPSVYYRVVPA